MTKYDILFALWKTVLAYRKNLETGSQSPSPRGDAQVHTFLLFDIDGSVTRGGGRSDHPHQPPEELSEALGAASRHQTVVLVTGQPASVAIRMREMLGGLNGAPVLPEYGTVMVDARGTKRQLLTPQQAGAFQSLRRRFERELLALGGELDHRQVDLGLNAFWANQAAFEAAQTAWQRLVGNDEQLHEAFVNGGTPACRFQWNRCDWSMNVLPVLAGKHVAVTWAQSQGRIVVAGGDTSSDVPLLEAAEHPIALHDEGDEVHPDLAAIATRKGGYIAREHEPHGHGALAGLRQAHAAGYIRL